MRIGKTGWRVGIVVLIGAGAFVVSVPPATTQSSDPPQYDSAGRLLRPSGFETWVMVGSNYGLAYESTSDKPEFHNVYISPRAYAEFVRSRTFPDRTVFVIDRRTAGDRDPELKAGFFNDQPLGILAAVKNMHRPDTGKKLWAYYVFPLNGPDAVPAEPEPTDAMTEAEKEKTCEGCHAKVNAKTDNVWVRFYPILRDMKK